MKKTILLALIAILFLVLFTGCRAYRRTTPVTPGYEVTNTDGRATTRGFHYRPDGFAARDGVARDGHHGGSVTHGQHYRHDGRVTDRDGIIGNGTFADRPAAHNSARRYTDGMDLATRNTYGRGTTGTSRTMEARARDGVRIDGAIGGNYDH